jgi:hypothetical protein
MYVAHTEKNAHNILVKNQKEGENLEDQDIDIRTIIKSRLITAFICYSCLLQCDAASLGEWFSTFRISASPSSSRLEAGLRNSDDPNTMT